jgi:conjugal transfer/entry exclusion protein
MTNKTNTRRAVRVAAVAAMVCMSTLSAAPARAGSVAGNGGATEVTQILNNAELALQTITEEMTFIQTEINTYYGMLQQMPIGVGEFATSLGEIQKTYSTLQTGYNQMQRLYGSVSSMKDLAQYRFNSFAATGLDWKSYVLREQSAIGQRSDRLGIASDVERQALEQVQSNFRVVQDFQSKIGSTTGTHGAMTVMNGQLNTLLSMTNAAMNHRVMEDQLKTIDAQEENARKAGVIAEAQARKAAQEAVDKANKTALDAARWKSTK